MEAQITTAAEAQRKEQTNSVKEIEKKHAIEVSKLKATIKKLEGRIAAKDTEFLELASSVRDVKAKLNQLIGDVEAETQGKNAQIDKLEAELMSERQENDYMSAALDDLEMKNLEAKENYKHLEVEMRKLTSERSREKADNDRDVRALNAKLVKARLEKTDLSQKLDAAKKKHQAELLEMKRICEVDVKKARLEMEGKLEKMKEKMMSMYNEEVTKRQRLLKAIVDA